MSAKAIRNYTFRNFVTSYRNAKSFDKADYRRDWTTFT